MDATALYDTITKRGGRFALNDRGNIVISNYTMPAALHADVSAHKSELIAIVNAASNGHAELARTAAKVKAPAHKGTYTQVPNIVFELPARLQLEQSAFCVLVHLCRLTYGMHVADRTTTIGLARLSERTGMAKTTLVHALTLLEKHRLIVRTRRTDSFGRQATTTIQVTLPEE